MAGRCRPAAYAFASVAAVTLALQTYPVDADSAEACGATWSAINMNSLKLNQKAVSEDDPARKAALQALLTEADKILEEKPTTILDKDQLPPSGNKQDYMSLGPYWWPDPKKTDGLPWIRQDGKANPLAYANTSDKARLRTMSGRVEVLALAYYYTRQQRYADQAVAWLDTWFVNDKTRINPHLKYAQSIPGRTEGRSVGIIDARQFVRVLDALSLIECANVLSPRQSTRIRDWYTEMLDWLLTSDLGVDERNAHNNHGTHYDAITISMALFVGQEETARALINQTKQRIVTQIRPSGEQPHELERTRPFHYSVFNLEALFRIAAMAQSLGIDLWHYPSQDDARLQAALNFLVHRQDTRHWRGTQEQRPKLSVLDSYLRRATLIYQPNSYRQKLNRSDTTAAALNCTLLYPGSTDLILNRPLEPSAISDYRRCAY